MKPVQQLHLTTGFDRRLISPQGGRRHLVIDLKVPACELDDGRRPPLHLALVIDASGSMNGAPLLAAQSAARGVVESLRSCDRVTVVSFASDVCLHVDTADGDGRGKARALDAIDALETRGCTNLYGGWEAGVERLDEAAVEGEQRRLVLLSDGHANQGEVDPEALGLHAEAAQLGRVFTSCIGIGDGYSPAQLQALAEHGGGRLHHAANAGEIVEVLLGELGEIRRLFTESARLSIELPAGIGAEPIGPTPWSLTAEGMVMELGGLVSGTSRTLVIRLAVPRLALADRFAASVWLDWTDAASQILHCEGPVSATMLCAPMSEVATETIDPVTTLALLKLIQRDIVRRATNLVEQRDQDAAAHLVREELHEFESLARDVNEARKLVDTLRLFLDRLKRPISPALSKEVMFFCCKSIRGEADMREKASSHSLDTLFDLD